MKDTKKLNVWTIDYYPLQFHPVEEVVVVLETECLVYHFVLFHSHNLQSMGIQNTIQEYYI